MAIVELESLQRLHIGYKNALTTLEESLSECPSQLIEFSEQKILYFKQKIAQVAHEIDRLNSNKLRFSLEFMSWNYGLLKNPVQIHFITTSNAYNIYGAYITGIVLLDKDELSTLTQRVIECQHNDGNIKFEEMMSDTISESVKNALREKGFMASEIDHIF